MTIQRSLRLLGLFLSILHTPSAARELSGRVSPPDPARHAPVEVGVKMIQEVR